MQLIKLWPFILLFSFFTLEQYSHAVNFFSDENTKEENTEHELIKKVREDKSRQLNDYRAENPTVITSIPDPSQAQGPQLGLSVKTKTIPHLQLEGENVFFQKIRLKSGKETLLLINPDENTGYALDAQNLAKLNAFQLRPQRQRPHKENYPYTNTILVSEDEVAVIILSGELVFYDLQRNFAFQRIEYEGILTQPPQLLSLEKGKNNGLFLDFFQAVLVIKFSEDGFNPVETIHFTRTKHIGVSLTNFYVYQNQLYVMSEALMNTTRQTQNRQYQPLNIFNYSENQFEKLDIDFEENLFGQWTVPTIYTPNMLYTAFAEFQAYLESSNAVIFSERRAHVKSTPLNPGELPVFSRTLDTTELNYSSYIVDGDILTKPALASNLNGTPMAVIPVRKNNGSMVLQLLNVNKKEIIDEIPMQSPQSGARILLQPLSMGRSMAVLQTDAGGIYLVNKRENELTGTPEHTLHKFNTTLQNQKEEVITAETQGESEFFILGFQENAVTMIDRRTLQVLNQIKVFGKIHTTLEPFVLDNGIRMSVFGTEEGMMYFMDLDAREKIVGFPLDGKMLGKPYLMKEADGSSLLLVTTVSGTIYVVDPKTQTVEHSFYSGIQSPELPIYYTQQDGTVKIIMRAMLPAIEEHIDTFMSQVFNSTHETPQAPQNTQVVLEVKPL